MRLPAVELKDPCRRTIVWRGVVHDILAPDHVFAWSGAIPCTGSLRCIYCQQWEDDYDDDDDLYRGRAARSA